MKTARALQAAFGIAAYVRTQGPIGLDAESEPEPDVAVVPGTVEDYGRVHPSRAVLVVEVSESSLVLDREYKGSLYARGGVPEYWVLNLIDRVLEIYRDPGTDPPAAFGWRYTRTDALGPIDSVAPLAAPDASIAVPQLLP